MSIHVTEQNAPAFHLTDEEILARRPHGKGRAATLTRSLCHAAGTDAANRQMREAGRTAWSLEDANLAVEVTMRFIVLGGFLPPEVYPIHTGKPFPYVRGNDGSWIKLQQPT